MKETLKELNRILASSLRELGRLGESEKACELAANAWSILREVDEREAERMNGVLHQLTSTKCGSSQPAAEDGSGATDDFDLEVRHLPPAKRHELIFDTYHKLQPGQGFILINDHDPKPLYYQLAFEHPDAFTWTPVESGPEVWRVRIGKP